MEIHEVCFPRALQMFLDDVGWFYGRDERSRNMPSRTGLPRRHVPADYAAIHELGKAIGQRVGVAFVIGDWDRNRVLARVPMSNWLGENWNGSEYFVQEEAEKIRDYVNASEFIDISLHGLEHDCWLNGENIGGREFFIPEGMKKGGKAVLAPESQVRQHLDAFFEIYRTWQFNKPIRNFVSPGAIGGAKNYDGMTKILHEYGIRTWCNGLKTDVVKEHSFVSNGVIFNKKTFMLAPWEAYDLNPDTYPMFDPEKVGILYGHWPNILRYDPERNLEGLDAWKRLYDRQCEVFGILRSRDIEFAHCQQIYRNYGKIEKQGDAVVLDMTDADAIMPADMARPFYISVRHGGGALRCEGADCTLYERKKEFDTYCIDRKGSASPVKLYR